MSNFLRTGWSLKKWQDHLEKMFGHVNKERHPLTTFARVVEMATGISRGARGRDRELIQDFFPRFLAWLLGLASQLDINLEEAVWNTYPGICPYCKTDKDCGCTVNDNYNRIKTIKESQEYQKKYSKPKNLIEWEAMFGKIYGAINNELRTINIITHFIEELGELCEIIRFSLITPEQLKKWKIQITKEEIIQLLNEEFSDLFAWYCGLSAHLGVEIDFNMSEIYREHCPICINDVCECAPDQIHIKIRLGKRKKFQLKEEQNNVAKRFI